MATDRRGEGGNNASRRSDSLSAQAAGARGNKATSDDRGAGHAINGAAFHEN